MKTFIGKRGSGKTTAAIEAAYLTDSILVEPTAPSAKAVQLKADEWLSQKYGAKKGAVDVISAKDLFLFRHRDHNVVIDELAWSIAQAFDLKPDSIKFVSIDDNSRCDDQTVTISKEEHTKLKNALDMLNNITQHIEVGCRDVEDYLNLPYRSLDINIAGLKHALFGSDNLDVEVTIKGV